ncbi:NAD(P)-binding protein, partial [Stipitochalara longipes BDJ]
MSDHKIFLITSATGSQGGSTARELLSQGHKVHALVRNLSSPAALALQDQGAILFKGDFHDLPAIAAAIEGVHGVFLNTFPDFTSPDGEVGQAQNIVAAAKAAKTVKIVVVSTVHKAAEQAEITKERDEYPLLKYYYAMKTGVEKVVREAGFEAWTVLRPDWLHYQYFAPACNYRFPDYQKTHELTLSYAPTYKKHHFSPHDVGKFAAAALVGTEGYNGEIIELTGEGLTFDEVAVILSRVSGVKIRARYRSEEETRELQESGKMPTLQMDLYAREGPYSEYDPKKLERFGIKLESLEEFLVKEKEKLLETLGVK